MANHYTQASFEITATPVDIYQFLLLAETFEEFIEQYDGGSFKSWAAGKSGSHIQAIERFIDESEALEYESIGFRYSREGDEEIWVHADDSVNVETTAVFIRIWMSVCDIDKSISFTWANTCDKPRLDGFSGGGVVITKDDEYWFNSDDFAWRTAAGVLLPPASMQLAQVHDKTNWSVKDNLELMDEFISSEPYMRARFNDFIARKMKDDDDT